MTSKKELRWLEKKDSRFQISCWVLLNIMKSLLSIANNFWYHSWQACLLYVGYLLQAAPPPARDPGFHPPRQRQQLVVSLPPLRLLPPFFLCMIRVRLVLPLQPAPLLGLHHPLRLASVLIVVLFFPGAGGWRAVVSAQERALSARHWSAVVARTRPGIAPVPVLLHAVLLQRALEVGLGSRGGGGRGKGALVTVVQDRGGQADLSLLWCVHLGFPHWREHFPLVQAFHVCTR